MQGYPCLLQKQEGLRGPSCLFANETWFASAPSESVSDFLVPRQRIAPWRADLNMIEVRPLHKDYRFIARIA
jgi:hypothetical protein